MIPNMNDGTSAPPRMRCYLNWMTLDDLPASSTGPAAAAWEARLAAISKAGYQGVQFVEPLTREQLAACARLNLGIAGSGRVNEPKDAEELAARFAAEGIECATLHVGWGLEDDEQAALLIEAVLAASARHGVPLYVETHRATIFQDMWRTVQFVQRFPELRFNGDFSHWYTGLEMVYGGFGKKFQFIRPVLERVRFLHGRIGDPGSMQVDVGSGDVETHPYVADFRELWSASFAGFLDRARPGDYILFVPELLSPRIYYARCLAANGMERMEECDRWQQALVLRRIAGECFESAMRAAGTKEHKDAN
jgi:sugar phosphate isomerase/epimerase